MRLTILGCGASSGVPLIGCGCAVCRSPDAKNKRLRASALFEVAGKHLLIDTSPDLRAQALAADIRRIDAVLYTHDHADHTHGIDELRSFNYLRDDSLPIHADAPTLRALQERFAYAFQSRPKEAWFRPQLIPHEIAATNGASFNVLGVNVTAIHQIHGATYSLGFRIGNAAYCTDVSAFPDTSWPLLQGLDVWVIDCLRLTHSHSHSRLETTLEWIARAKPKRAVLTHMAHDLDYEAFRAALPDGVEPGYDGMVIEC